MKQINNIKSLTLVVAALCVIAFAGCKKDSAEGSYTYFGKSNCTDELLIVSQQGYIGAAQAASVTYDMYSDYGAWTIVPDYSKCFDTSKAWINIWPYEGDADGRFKVSFLANNEQGETRYADINVVSGGKIIKTIKVEQAPTAARLDVPAFLKTVVFHADAVAKKSISLNTNVFWGVDIPEEAMEWLTVSNQKQYSFDVSVIPNDGEERRATLTIYQLTNPNFTQRISIVQEACEETPEPEPEPENPETPENPGEGGEGDNTDASNE